MFQRIGQLLKDSESLSISVKRVGEKLTVSLSPTIEGQDLSPFAAKGSPEELDEKLFNAFSESMNRAREFYVNGEAMVQSAKEAAGKSKSKTTKAPATTAKTVTKPVTQASISGNLDSKPDDDDDDDQDQDEDGDDNPIDMTAGKAEPKKPEKVEKPFKATKAQEKIISQVKANVDMAMSKNDADMVRYLKTQSMNALKAAEIPSEEYEAKFDEKIQALELEEKKFEQSAPLTSVPPVANVITPDNTKESAPEPEPKVAPTPTPVQTPGPGIKIPPAPGASVYGGVVTPNPNLF